MKRVLMTCLFVGLFQFAVQNVYACQCDDHFTPLIVHYSKAEAVFVGKVLNVKKFGNESEKESWYPRYRAVEFQLQKTYKGFDSSPKRIVLHTIFNSAACGFDEDKKPKKGQNWIVFVHKDEEENLLYFGGMCEPSSSLEDADDLADYEKHIFSYKDKQAILGTVVDEKKIEGIKGIEVILEGEGQKITTKTDEKGKYYFPCLTAGNYKVTINLPFIGFVISFLIKRTEINHKSPIKTMLTYNVQLKESEFYYEETDIYK